MKKTSVLVGLFLLFTPFTTFASSNSYSTSLSPDFQQYWSIPNANQTGLNLGTQDFTISLWFKPASIKSLQWLILKFGSPAGYGINLGDTGPLFVETYLYPPSGGTYETNAISNLTLNKWAHIVSVRTSSYISIYIDGISTSTNSTGSGTAANDTSNSGPFTIGAADNLDNFTDGSIDDVRIWTRQLSDSEINSLYSAPCTFTNGDALQGWWQFENDGNDSSGNGNNLTGHNSPTFSTNSSYTCAPSDTTPPVITITSGPADGSTSTSGDISFSFSIEEGPALSCAFDYATTSACTSPFATSTANGSHIFSVTAADAASNAATSTITFTVAIPAPPEPETPPTPEPTPTSPSPNTSGGGSQPVGSSPTAPGFQTVNTVSASAPLDTNAPATTELAHELAVEPTPAINTLSQTLPSNTVSDTGTQPPPSTPNISTENSQNVAAAAQSNFFIPLWLWALLLVLLFFGLGWLTYIYWRKV